MLGNQVARGRASETRGLEKGSVQSQLSATIASAIRIRPHYCRRRFHPRACMASKPHNPQRLVFHLHVKFLTSPETKTNSERVKQAKTLGNGFRG
jgi:hypothetical protein